MSKPTILIIDDVPENQNALSLLVETSADEPIAVMVRHPRDVDEIDLKQANLILLDYDLGDWPERDENGSICQRPADGLALGAVIRSQLKILGYSAPVSFAIYTGELAKLASPLPSDNREHALAGLVNVDWIFQKSANAEILIKQVTDLALAVERLPETWSSEGALTQLGELLGLDFHESENQQYLNDIENCLPPIHELSEWSHGIAVIRWLLHRIFPYPTFLLNIHYLAARFRLDPPSLASQLTLDKSLYAILNEFQYNGILSDFSDARWWRSGIEDFLWKITKGNSADFRAVRDALEKITGEKLVPSVPPDFPVICLDEDYKELRKFYREEEVVRIRPDHYPSYADQPWISKELAEKNPKMRSLVIGEDLELLD